MSCCCCMMDVKLSSLELYKVSPTYSKWNKTDQMYGKEVQTRRLALCHQQCRITKSISRWNDGWRVDHAAFSVWVDFDEALQFEMVKRPPLLPSSQYCITSAKLHYHHRNSSSVGDTKCWLSVPMDECFLTCGLLASIVRFWNPLQSRLLVVGPI